MRLFVACDPPPALCVEIEAALADARSELPPARWLPSRNWHITLLFLGDVEDGRIAPLRERLGGLQVEHGFEATLARAGAFPAGRARVLWVGLEPLDAFQRLASAVRHACGDLGDGQPRFHPHLSVARCRQPWSRRSVERFADGIEQLVGRPFAVDSVALYRSRLESSGARYELLERVGLGAHRSAPLAPDDQAPSQRER